MTVSMRFGKGLVRGVGGAGLDGDAGIGAEVAVITWALGSGSEEELEEGIGMRDLTRFRMDVPLRVGQPLRST